ncbi:MAG: response regulator, partial [Dehalococcoidales bacterium]|nr:response regulator [Dehalococcoidales bacterium]
TEKGSVSLKLRGKKQSDGALTLTIVVWDTGIGIKPEDKEILFNKFQRLEMERNSTVEGTGLGLAITQHLIELMGGTIDVESEYGKGSIFTVTIPQKIVSDNPIGDFQTRLKENLPGERPYRESFRAPDAVILVVDDTRINLTVAVNLLKNTKIRVDTAISGAEAVSMASKTRYDMIFMDQRMPEMTGTEAFHQIRNTPDGASRDVPVVCLTADAVIGAKERYLSEGFSDYLTKPIDNYALEKMLMKYLPEDKIELVTEELTDDSGESGEEMDYFDTLRSVGIEPKNGLKFCQDDEAFYRVMLAEYAYGELEKAHNLQKSYESENWHDYSIYVHALKSSSKMIGASALSMRAAKLESAANSEDFGTIRTEHDSMMEEYEVMTAVIRSAIPKNAMDTDNDNITEYSPDEDIIEFLPDSEE